MPSPPEEWSVDTEWGYHGSRVGWESQWEPVVLCLVGLRSGRRLSFWGRDARLRHFFREHRDDLFIAHNAPAEIKYLLRLGVSLPPRWFDTMAAWRYATNRPRQPGDVGCGLVACLHALGLPRLAPEVKKELRDNILHLRFDQDCPEARRRVTSYCLTDCDSGAALYDHLKAKVPPGWMNLFSQYLQAVSRMELRGIPLDLTTYDRLQGEAAHLLALLREEINMTWPVYDDGVFKKKAFFSWCKAARIGWPTKLSPATGKNFLSVDADTMKAMEGRHSFIKQLRQVRKTEMHLGKRTLVIDRGTGRHYFDTFTLGSVTGRNQPHGFIFGGPKWQRWLMIPESPDHLLIYVDYVAQEIGVAAALSGDPAMRAAYEAVDCHMSFAIRAGAAPAGAVKKTHAEVRKQYKTVNLGIQYGQTAFGVSQRLGITHHDAAQIVAEHKRLFPVFWSWSDRTVQKAYDSGRIATPCGWRSHVPPCSNERTWLNWMQQSVGGDIMRATVVYLDRQNVRLLAPIHDGFLLSCRRDQVDDLRAAVDFACRHAVEHSLPGFPMRWEMATYATRFEDEDGADLWHHLLSLLERGRHAATVG
jgi:DNA polymerase I-like protein with 3'-5' exonuclease and polymerase domains